MRGRRPEASGHSGGGPEAEGADAGGRQGAPEGGETEDCQGGRTTTRSNEGGGAYRWADEGGRRAGCPTVTSSWRETTQQEQTQDVYEEELEEELEPPQNHD